MTTIYVGAHYQVSGGVVTKYYFAGTQRIAERKGGVLSYILADHLGSTGVVTDAAGTVIAEVRYTPYGETRFASGASPTDYLYTSQRQEAGLGLYFYNARWFDPYLNQFSQPDTIVPNPYNPQSYNRYGYVLNNPIRYNDPSGHCVLCIVASALLGAYIGYQAYTNIVAPVLAQGPDMIGIHTAGQHMNPETDSVIVAAAISVQSQWYVSAWDNSRSIGYSYEHKGLGIAQVSDSQMAHYEEKYGLVGDQTNPSVAVQAMAYRIQEAQEGCLASGPCDSTDLFITAALSQNGPGFDASSFTDISRNAERNIDWETNFSSRNFKSGLPGIREQISGGRQYDTRLMLQLYTNDIQYLLNNGWSLPKGYENINWNRINKLGSPPKRTNVR